VFPTRFSRPSDIFLPAYLFLFGDHLPVLRGLLSPRFEDLSFQVSVSARRGGRSGRGKAVASVIAACVSYFQKYVHPYLFREMG
jgi:hypothetical protein